MEVDPGVDHQLLAAGARAEDDPDLLAVLVGDLEAGVGERLLAGGDAEVDATISLRRTALGSIQSVALKSRTSPAAFAS